MAMLLTDPPPVRYVGAKWMLADWIKGNMPPHDLYCEPFCGGASVFFRKEPSAIEVINDLSGDVVNFFRVLRTRADELIQAIELTPYSREEYHNSYEPCEDELERARRFYVKTRQSFGSSGGRKTGWRAQRNRNRGTSVTNEWRRVEGLYKAVDRLKNAHIECDTAINVIQRYDSPKSLFYVDPPYVFSSRSDGGRARYSHEMSDSDHRQLAEVLQRVQGAVMLSGYKSELYEELYGHWRVLEKSTTTNGNSMAIEYLWLSPNAVDLGKLPLFEGITE